MPMKIVKNLYETLLRVFFLASSTGFFGNVLKKWSATRGLTQTNTAPNSSESYVMLFASSLGEFETLRFIIRGIRDHAADLKVHLVFFSPSGYEQVIKKKWAYDIISYAPLDTQSSVERFFDGINIRYVVISGNSIWPNLLGHFITLNVPYLFVNSTFRRKNALYPLYFRFVKAFLEKAEGIWVNNRDSHEFLSSYGLNKTIIVKNMRLTGLLKLMDRDFANPVSWPLAKTSDRILLCGSTHFKDELLISEAWKSLEDVVLVIAPHHVDQSNLSSLKKLFPSATTWDALSHGIESKVVIVNQMGLLKHLYSYADVAYVGGGFGKGVHNILEPAIRDIPVLFGPNYDNAPEAKMLIGSRMAHCIHKPEELVAFLQRRKPDGQVESSIRSSILMEGEDGIQLLLERLKKINQ